ncbi:hypothetical protein B0H13DRAFT_2435210 [Mycena leptocephala]|nr:hypothetical protein B0H13DRAFT_2435210 [Mycena leptocephala]
MSGNSDIGNPASLSAPMLNNPEKSVHTPPEKPAGAIFALIIGVNDYFKPDDLHPLRGAVNDARAFKKYLSDFNVPSSNIILLENENATRLAILSAFESHLLDNPNIPDHGDATMICSSRVTEAALTLPATSLHRIAGSRPYVRWTKGRRTMPGSISCDPRLRFDMLLSRLADKKGTNITVILDCCHSAGMERDVDRTCDARTARSDSCPIPLDLDSHFWKGKTETAQSHRMWSHSSHVVLAACLAGETARESCTLTERITVVLPHTSSPSYDIPPRVSHMLRAAESDTEKMAGTNTLLWRRQEQSSSLQWELPSCRSTLRPADAAEIIQVQKRQQLAVVSDRDGDCGGGRPRDRVLCLQSEQPLFGHFVAQSVRVGETILVWKQEKEQPPVDIQPWSRAVVSDWKSSPALVHTPADFPHTSVLFPTTGTARLPNFMPARSLEEAHIAPRLALGDPAHLPHAIDGVAHFSYFLDCAKRRIGSRRWEYIKDGEVRLTSEVGSQYGFTIRNTSDEDSTRIYSISTKRHTRSKLVFARSRGCRAAAPKRGNAVELRFLKLFVTNDYIDLGWIQQELSPFDPQFVGTGRLRMSHEPLDLSTRWDAIWDARTVTLTITAQ